MDNQNRLSRRKGAVIALSVLNLLVVYVYFIKDASITAKLLCTLALIPAILGLTRLIDRVYEIGERRNNEQNPEQPGSDVSDLEMQELNPPIFRHH